MKELMFLIAFIPLVIFSSCGKDDPVDPITDNPDDLPAPHSLDFYPANQDDQTTAQNAFGCAAFDNLYFSKTLDYIFIHGENDGESGTITFDSDGTITNLFNDLFFSYDFVSLTDQTFCNNINVKIRMKESGESQTKMMLFYEYHDDHVRCRFLGSNDVIWFYPKD